MIPWSTLAWTQVHHGHLPLWNPYSGLGLPLAFNWQSAVFSLPALIGYLLPLHLAYTAQIIVTLVVAGTGAYALARVLGLGVHRLCDRRNGLRAQWLFHGMARLAPCRR